MTTQPMMTRQQEIRAIWRQYQGLYVVAGILIGLLLFPLLELVVHNLQELLLGLVPEAIGIGFTVFLLDRIYEHRETERLKKRLVREAGSSSNSTALTAIDWLRSEGWLRGRAGLLKSEQLVGANLEGAYLAYSNLLKTNLRIANLSRANLGGANLRGAILNYANLEDANLFGAVLECADMEFTHLKGAMLHGANLVGANILGVDLTNAELKDTILPDGTNYRIDTTDISIFTDSEHPEYEATLSKINDLRQIRGIEKIEISKPDWILPDWIDE